MHQSPSPLNFLTYYLSISVYISKTNILNLILSQLIHTPRCGQDPMCKFEYAYYKPSIIHEDFI